MNRSIKPIQFLLFLITCFIFGCQSESKIFIGQWVDSRESNNIWEITKSGSTFIGKRISGEDYYKYDSEEWSFEIGQHGFPTLNPKTDNGSTIIYQAKQNRILRSPPGRTYIKVVKE